MRLETLVRRAARQTPDAPAVWAPDGQATYAELDQLADTLARRLLALGVEPGDRVAFWLDRGLNAIVTMQAVLRCGAAYVPLDPKSPPARIRFVVDSCAPTVVVCTGKRAARLEFSGTVLLLDGGVEGADCRVSLPRLDPEATDDLAYILFTSGSTGTPKGVCLSHRNALAFVDWATTTIAADPSDRFASFAPFHFDLSVFDIYGCFAVAGRLCIASEMLSLAPARIVGFVREHEISVWYSVPSLLMLMEDTGLFDEPALEPRVVIFAGEAFPVAPLGRLRVSWPGARMFNWYGPTETNVCTSYEVKSPPTSPIPIGGPASDAVLDVLDEDGRPVGVGEEGELHVAGPTVMLGYWGGEPQPATYATGDRVRINERGDLEFIGRNDSMLKVRGNRVEAAEVEAALRGHPDVEDAFVGVDGSGRQAKLVAALLGGSEAGKRPSLLSIKRVCAEVLPAYMIVDRVCWLDDFPRTRNGKRDRQRLRLALQQGHKK